MYRWFKYAKFFNRIYNEKLTGPQYHIMKFRQSSKSASSVCSVWFKLHIVSGMMIWWVTSGINVMLSLLLQAKQIELNMTMGEALVFAAQGITSSAARDTWTETEDEFNVSIIYR